MGDHSECKSNAYRDCWLTKFVGGESIRRSLSCSVLSLALKGGRCVIQMAKYYR